MAKGLLFGQDAAVAQAIFTTYKIVPILYNEAIGIMKDGQFSGAILLHWWNGPNIHVSYYGPETVTLGMARTLCNHLLKRYNVSRITVTVPRSRKDLSRWLVKIGALHEGNMRCFYGYADTAASIAAQYSIFKPQIERIAWRQVADKTGNIFSDTIEKTSRQIRNQRKMRHIGIHLH